MTNRIYGATALAAALLSLMLLLTPASAHAQSPCVVQRVINNTGCPFTMYLYDALGNVRKFAIAAGPAVTTNISLGAFVPVGAQDVFGNQYPFVAPPTPGCTQCFSVNPAAVNCCASICYDEPNCVFRVNPCLPPC